MRKDIIEQKDQILLWIEQGLSKAEISRKLNCNQKTLQRYLDNWEINYVGNQSGRGLVKKRLKWTLEEYLKQSTDIQSYKVRNKLLEEGHKEHRCERCGLTEWLGEPIPLELHHIDGNHNHNEISNYQLLCPNCHAFTESYRGKNCRNV